MIATVELTQATCWCGMPHAVPRALYDGMLRDHNDGNKQCGIYCPRGHSWTFAGDGKAAVLERELKARTEALIREKQRHDQTAAALRTSRKQTAAEKGVVTKLKKRASAGVCPCCNRTFQQLARHMQGKHPEFVAEQSKVS